MHWLHGNKTDMCFYKSGEYVDCSRKMLEMHVEEEVQLVIKKALQVLRARAP